MTIVSSLVDSATSLAQPVIQDYYNQKAEERQEQANIRAEEREQGYIISSENRANAEYDRRLADQRLYDSPEAVAARYAKAGINPVSAFSGGVVGQTSGISPSGGKAPSAKPVTAQNLQYQPTNLLDNMEKVSAIENTNAQTELIEQQTESEFQKGYSQFIDNCMQRVLIGDRSNVHVEEFNFKPNYTLQIGDDGKVNLVKVSGALKKTLEDNTANVHNIGLDVVTFKNDVYGDIKIHTQSRWIKQVDGELSKLEGMNTETAQRISTYAVTLYTQILTAMASGTQADASMITALANQMEANFKYNSQDGNFGTKWWVETIFKGITAGKDVVGIITDIISLLPKSAVKVVKEIFDGDGVHKGTTYTTTY